MIVGCCWLLSIVLMLFDGVIRQSHKNLSILVTWKKINGVTPKALKIVAQGYGVTIGQFAGVKCLNALTAPAAGS